MPIYEFRCKKCAEEFELTKPASQMPRTAKCPSCGARAPRMLSMFALVRGAAPDVEKSSDAEPEDFGGMGGDDLGMGDDFDF